MISPPRLVSMNEPENNHVIYVLPATTSTNTLHTDLGCSKDGEGDGADASISYISPMDRSGRCGIMVSCEGLSPRSPKEADREVPAAASQGDQPQQ